MSHAKPPRSDGSARRVPLVGLLLLFYLSGAAALVYQVLWLKELTRLFGVSAYATSTTLAVFFLGLAAGGWVWGRRAAGIARPLRGYALLEVAIAASALLYFALFDAYRLVGAPLLEALGSAPAAALAVKLLLAVGILFLPAFFMGGTLPLMAQYLVRHRSELGSRATLLYAVNTVGAATGALAAGFFLPPLLGFRGAYFVAIGVNLLVAALTAGWDRRAAASAPAARTAEGPSVTQEVVEPAADPPLLGVGAVRLLAAFSGFATLALEVLWTRMFAQVLQNSVYTFALILTLFLLCLAAGAALANRLCARVHRHRRALADLLLLSGLAVAVTPWVFQWLADELAFWKSGAGFWGYLATVFGGAVLVLAPAIVLMGAVFPYLMKISERTMTSAGRTVGELAAVNTVSAIAGSVVAGFVLIGWLGLWASQFLFGGLYLVVAAVAAPRPARMRHAVAAAGAVGCVLLAVTHELPVVQLSTLGAGAGSGAPEEEVVVETWQGPDGTVAVVRHGAGNLRLRVNSSYSLGTSASAVNERLQGQIPFLLHPDPRRVFFLGLGTGITASGAMAFPFDELTVCEVNRDVVRAARKHFAPWLEGLFEDPRVRVVPEDGRTYLAVTDETYDLVVADIFLTYKAGVGSLYTLEHFRTVRERLAPGGLFVQWMPVFDTSPQELAIVARTMLEVFPSVTLWRRSFSPVFPVYALVGSMEEAPLDMERLERGLGRLRREAGLDPRTWILNIPLAAYVANLSRLSGHFADAPLNTDDRTVLEYLAPITERDAKGAGTARVLAWDVLLRYLEDLLARAPPETDPYLARASPVQRDQVRAGTAFYGYEVMRRMGDEAASRAYLARYRALLEP